jgi:hypothetical protein
VLYRRHNVNVGFSDWCSIAKRVWMRGLFLLEYPLRLPCGYNGGANVVGGTRRKHCVDFSVSHRNDPYRSKIVVVDVSMFISER